MKKSNVSSFDRFYLSPFSGRVIKSTGKLFEMLRSEGYLVDKHKCFYNIKSAKKCLDKLFDLYPALQPPTKFRNLSKTYKKGKARGFIQDKKTSNIIGFVNKKGEIQKLKTPIPSKNKNFIKIQDPMKMLDKIIEKTPQISAKMQKEIELQFKKDEPILENNDKTLIYNPIQNDIIPVDENLSNEEQKILLETINEILIPEELPPITKSSKISGLIRENDTIVGIVTTDNDIKKIIPKIHIKLAKNTPVILVKSILKPITPAPSTPTTLVSTPMPTPIPTPTLPSTPTTLVSTPILTPEQKISEIFSETESEIETGDEIESQLETVSDDMNEIIDEAPSDILTDLETEPVVEVPEPVVEVSEPVVEVSEPVVEVPEPVVEVPEPVVEVPEPVVEVPTIQISEDIIPTLPILKQTPEIEKELETSKTIDGVKTVTELKCLENEQLDINSKRCLPCGAYNLVWDPEYKKCKIELSEEIGSVIVTQDDKMIGYTGVNK